GRYAFCGGMEFTKEYAREHRHDVHALVEGPVVTDLERHFVTHWREARTVAAHKARSDKSDVDAGDLGDAVSRSDPSKTRHAVQVAITKSDDGWFNYSTVVRGVFDAYVSAVSEAQVYIYIENQ